MKRFFITTAVLVMVAGVGWRYAPADTRESMLGFIGGARQRSGTAVRDALSRALPDDPAVRRAAVAGELRRAITEMERRAGISPTAFMAGAEQGAGVSQNARPASGADIAQKTEDLIRELESSAPEPSLPRRITERVLDAMLPASKSNADCPVK